MAITTFEEDWQDHSGMEVQDFIKQWLEDADSKGGWPVNLGSGTDPETGKPCNVVQFFKSEASFIAGDDPIKTIYLGFGEGQATYTLQVKPATGA